MTRSSANEKPVSERKCELEFREEMRIVINKHSKENDSNTPDFVLANYLNDCLDAFDKAVNLREACIARPRRTPHDNASDSAKAAT